MPRLRTMLIAAPLAGAAVFVAGSPAMAATPTPSATSTVADNGLLDAVGGTVTDVGGIVGIAAVTLGVDIAHIVGTVGGIL